jgi:phosphatidylinositol alpha-1,6-mannosyltransferase
VVQLATASESLSGLWLHKWFKLPFVVYAHGNEILEALQRNQYKSRLALQQANRVLAVSQFTAHLVEQVGVEPERIAVVHPGCEVDHFRPLPPSMELRYRLLGAHSRDRVIITVGNLVSRKGHDMVIRALPYVRKYIPEVTYLIVGDGPCRTQLEILATAMGVRDYVIFAGQMPTEDLPAIYALSDVFIMPSRERRVAYDVEGFGLVFLEASACAKPVVGGRSGGTPDAVVDGVTGLLVNPHDPEDIARALIRLLTDYDLASQLGQQGRLRVVRDFTWGHVGNRVQDILDSVPGEKSC